jgi:aspartyl-tRNA(Asn)/glutamyl-tRNA(Gln) amidotransferase subunit C
MLTTDDIKQLSVLARIAVSPDEEESLAKDLDSVLGYVSEVSAITTDADAKQKVGELHNVMRSDDNAHEGGTFTDAIVQNMPTTQDGYLKVSKIF